MNRLRHTLRSLRHRNFQLFFVGQFISMTGTWMQGTAQMWLVYRLTRSPFLLGAVGFVGQAPAMLLGLVGGWTADRFDRRTVVIVTESVAMLQAFALAALTLSGHVRVWQVMGLALVMGMVNAFDMPARQSFVVRMVGPEDLPNAIALNSSLVNASRLVGPAMAGVLVGMAGEGVCFLANAVSYIAVLVSLLMMRMPPETSRIPAGVGLGAQVREGFGYVFRHGEIRPILFLLGVTSLAGVPFMVLLPLFADGIFHRGPQGLGYLTGAMSGGALLGAMLLASRREAGGMGVLAGAGAAVFGGGLVFFSQAKIFSAALAFAAISGAGMMTAFAAANTRMQALTTESMRGRVMSFFSMTFLSLSPVGSLLGGYLADRFGAPATVCAGGLICAAGGGLFLFRRKDAVLSPTPL